MLKRYFLLIFTIGLFSHLVATEVFPQAARLEARELEWNSYVIPDTSFTRMIGPKKSLVVRVPAEWKQDANGSVVTGPNSVSLDILLEEVPVGTSLSDTVGYVVKAVSHLPGATESVLVRKTMLQDIEAREIVLEQPDATGEMVRTTMWLAILGPSFIGMRFNAPVQEIHEWEPYFKAIIQSTMLPRNADLGGFELFRSTIIKESKAVPVREVQAIVSTMVADGVAPEPAVRKLAALFSQSPDAVVDLLEDRRLFVRLAAVEALANSRNASLAEFLWRAADDPEPLIASYAAQAVATVPDVVAKLTEKSFGGFRTELLARFWPHLPKQAQLQILQRIFSRPASAPIKQGLKSGVSVAVTEMAPLKPGQPPPPIIVLDNDPSVQLGALTLLKYTSLDEFKLPLAVILASNQDVLTVAALQVAIERREVLPVDELMKLARSTNVEISKLAAANLGFSGAVSDVPRIQSLLDQSKPLVPRAAIDEFKLAIEKIGFRNAVASATTKSAATEQETIAKGLANERLANFVWRTVCEQTPQRCGLKISGPLQQKDLKVEPYGENLWPDKPIHFAAIPKPAEAIQKLYQTMQNIQMNSARAQSNLVFMLGSMRQLAGLQLGALNDSRTLLEYTGIKGDRPIAVAGWTTEGAPSSVAAAQQQAVVLGVENRQQFERFVTLYQRNAGSFGEFPIYVAAVSRLMPALPALLPITAKTILGREERSPKTEYLSRASAIGNTEWNGFQIRVIEQTKVNNQGRIETDSTYVTYLGDTAIVAPDLATIRELLRRAASDDEKKTLKQNAEFQRLLKEGGEVIYLSDLSELTKSGENDQAAQSLNESGQLNLTRSTWENTHRLSFEGSGWSSPFIKFHPKDLKAPQSLLPSSTLAYVFTNLDLRTAWSKWFSSFSKETKEFERKFAVDFQAEVLDNLGPECGLALFDSTDWQLSKDSVWLAFFQLKNDKIKEAFKAGRLFSGIGPPTNDIVEIKVGAESYFISVHKEFFVISNQQRGLKALETNEFISSTDDYTKSAIKARDQVVFFGGYNLGAAIAAARRGAPEGLQIRQAEMFLSVAEAFHSQSFFATALPGGVEAQSTVSMDREGRYAVADLNFTKSSAITYVTVQSQGIPINDSKRLSTVVLRLRSKTPGAIEAIKKDVALSGQTVEQKSTGELLLTVSARNHDPEKQMPLPVTDPSMSQYLVATREILSTSPQVVQQAKQIVGNEKDAWTVAKKLADWTFKNLEWRLIANADANQTLASREADCSEFSQLFVAMARSLGLPARIVSGLAHSGSSFGGHAWVEVWIGKWIELDPTWGTDFVDATHIRSVADDLLTYAALNAVEIEVLEAKQSIAEFQKSPKALVEEVIEELWEGDVSALATSISLELLTNEMMGPDEWPKLTEIEREQLSSAFQRALIEVYIGYSPERDKKKAEDAEEVASPSRIRLLRIDEENDRAVATCYAERDSMLLKLHLLRSNGAWYLTEFVQFDNDLELFAETFQPAIKTIRARRLDKNQRPAQVSDFLRALTLFETNRKKSIEILDNALKGDPKNPRLRLLKVSALGAEENDESDARKLLTEMVNESSPFPPAMIRFAQWNVFSEKEEEKKQAREVLNRYLQFEPADIRAYSLLASVHDSADNLIAAEAAYRKVIEIFPAGVDGYLDLARFLVLRGRLDAVAPVLNDANKNTGAPEVLADLIDSLYFDEEYEKIEQLAAKFPLVVRASARVNVTLADIYVETKRPLKALPLLKLAVTLDRKSTDGYLTMAEAYRALSLWKLALEAADKAIARDFNSARGYFHRACALAKLRRTQEALRALKRVVELASYYRNILAEEEDLKSLASLEEFKKLVAKPEEPQPK